MGTAGIHFYERRMGCHLIAPDWTLGRCSWPFDTLPPMLPLALLLRTNAAGSHWILTPGLWLWYIARAFTMNRV